MAYPFIRKNRITKHNKRDHRNLIQFYVKNERERDTTRLHNTLPLISHDILTCIPSLPYIWHWSIISPYLILCFLRSYLNSIQLEHKLTSDIQLFHCLTWIGLNSNIQQGGGKGPEMLENYIPINSPCSPGPLPPPSPPLSPTGHSSTAHT